MDIRLLNKSLETATADLESKRPVGEATVAPISTGARYIAAHFEERDGLLAQLGSGVWTHFGTLWRLLADALDPSASIGDAVSSERALAVALGKLERNLLAGSVEAQKAAISSEPDIRRVIFNVTTFTRIEDPEYSELHAILAQLLCNLVSSRGTSESDTIAARTLDTWLEGGRDGDVIIRLLDSRDVRANTGILRLLLNLAPGRLSRFLAPPALSWLQQLLGRLDDWHSSDSGACFDLTVALFSLFFNGSLQGDLYAALGEASGGEEAVTPSQTTLLKLLDAWLTRPHPNPSPCPSGFVVGSWRATAAYAAASMRSGKDDARLPGVLAALVLGTEILSTTVLAVQARVDAKEQGGGEEELVESIKGRSSEGESIIPQLVDVLRATNDFLPRIKPTPTTAEENEAFAKGQVPDKVEHAFANVKRDLVRLLAVLAFNDIDVGNQVRAVEGVQLVLGLCETDERNAYLREHALFAVRNLMMGNPENQAIIAKMEPLGVVGEDGVLSPMPDKLKKSDEAAVRAGQS